MAEILHHLVFPKYCNYHCWGYIGWCKISSIHSSAETKQCHRVSDAKSSSGILEVIWRHD